MEIIEVGNVVGWIIDDPKNSFVDAPTPKVAVFEEVRVTWDQKTFGSGTREFVSVCILSPPQTAAA